MLLVICSAPDEDRLRGALSSRVERLLAHPDTTETLYIGLGTRTRINVSHSSDSTLARRVTLTILRLAQAAHALFPHTHSGDVARIRPLVYGFYGFASP